MFDMSMAEEYVKSDENLYTAFQLKPRIDADYLSSKKNNGFVLTYDGNTLIHWMKSLRGNRELIIIDFDWMNAADEAIRALNAFAPIAIEVKNCMHVIAGTNLLINKLIFDLTNKKILFSVLDEEYAPHKYMYYEYYSVGVDREYYPCFGDYLLDEMYDIESFLVDLDVLLSKRGDLTEEESKDITNFLNVIRSFDGWE